MGRAGAASCSRKWARELDYRLIKGLWAFDGARIAVRFAYEWHDDSGHWFRSYGNENWEFTEAGLMRRRFASINDLPIAEASRLFHWPLGRRPDDHPGLDELGLWVRQAAGLDLVAAPGFQSGSRETGACLNALTRPTLLLDFEHPALQALIRTRGWAALLLFERIGAVYAFVRGRIAFGYNAADDLPASAVLADGYGQCNTKGHAADGPAARRGRACRFHGFTIDKALQRARSPVWPMCWHRAASSTAGWRSSSRPLGQPRGLHPRRAYLTALQAPLRGPQWPFCGFGAATPNLQAPGVDWCGQDTYIQRDGISHDFGVF